MAKLMSLIICNILISLAIDFYGSFQVRQMLNAIILESDLQLSEEYLEAIIDKVERDFHCFKIVYSFLLSFSLSSFSFFKSWVR